MTRPAPLPDAGGESISSLSIEILRTTHLRRFLRVLLRPSTYRPLRNPYFLIGFLWGMPIPIVTIGIHLAVTERSPAFENVVACVGENPWHWLFLAHPFLFGGIFGGLGALLRERDELLSRALDNLRDMAVTDGLTGLLNHRAFQQRIREEAALADRENWPVTLLMIDLDRFKDFNDAHGHPAGDRLLQIVSDRLLELVRPYDIVCRYGGEEFAIILPGMNEKDATEAAERIRREIERLPIPVPDAGDRRITLSIGVATRRPEDTVASWIVRADTRLYRAKREGRNRVCGTEEGEPPVSHPSGAPASGF